MRLVEFTHTKKKQIYVNPEMVRSVQEYAGDKTMIYFNQTVTVVQHNVDYVVRKLTEE